MAPLILSYRLRGLQVHCRYRLSTFHKVQGHSRKDMRFWALPFLRQGPGSILRCAKGLRRGTEPLRVSAFQVTIPSASCTMRRSPDDLTPAQPNETQPTQFRPVFSGIDAAVKTLGSIRCYSRAIDLI
jgi:hypothetical protein